jgi:hypothetical protein
MKSPGIGSRETSAARNDSIITAHDDMQIGTAAWRFASKVPGGPIATGNSAGHSQMPIEKIHEFGFVLRVLQLLIVVSNIYNLLLSFIKSLNGNPAPEQSSALVPVHGQQLLSLFRQYYCELVGALRGRGQGLRQGRHRNFGCVGPQKPAHESKFRPPGGSRFIVRIAQCIGQELMARMTHAAQIDLRFGDPPREFFYSGVGVWPGYFTREHLHLFGQGWIGANWQA